MRQLFWIAVLATWACCAAAQTFTVVQNQSQAAAGQNQPQAVTESPNAAKGSKSKSKIDASGTTGDQMKKSRKEKAAAASDKPSRKTTSGNTAHNETSNNTAGSIAGNANAVGRTTGQTKPTRKNKQQAPPAGAQSAKAQPAPSAPEPKPEPKPAPVAMSGPAAPPYRAPAWLPQSPDSNTVRAQLKNALAQDESLVGTKVEVAVNDSEINLAGTVPGGREKLAAERIAKSFAGNRKVVNKLVVGVPAPQPANAAEPQPAPQKMNGAQPAANMPAASFAPPTHPADAPPASAHTEQKTPAATGEQSPSPR